MQLISYWFLKDKTIFGLTKVNSFTYTTNVTLSLGFYFTIDTHLYNIIIFKILNKFKQIMTSISYVL